MEYIEGSKEEGCVFCTAQEKEDGAENLIAFRGKHSFVILNRYPYTSGHLMVVPFDHKPALEELDPATRAEMMELTTRCMVILRKVYRPEAFNMGANIGEAAGAGVREHVHITQISFITVLPGSGRQSRHSSSCLSLATLPPHTSALPATAEATVVVLGMKN
jgi:diadenosine tetraphosphate (Ap4A) HIT family hydrolase